MAVSERIPVATGILEWARRTSGHDLDMAAKRLSVKRERLESWEAGETQPTINQLRQLAKLYKRPLAVLLLPTPPTDFDALRDFRRTGDTGQPQWSPALHAEYKRAITQREVVLELAELSPASLYESPGSFQISRDVSSDEAGKRLRELLGMDSWTAGTWNDPRKALRAAIEAVESLGILVLQTRDVAISEMRGFSISEWPYPAIILNGTDWPRPKLFTLLHELCHLALNSGGLCDLHEAPVKHRGVEGQVEHYCNQVAASALMPRDRILAERALHLVKDWSTVDLSELSHRYGASSEALLLRLVNLQLVSWDEYWRLKPELEEAYAEARKKEKERQKAADGGPSYFVIKARNLGHGYVHSVLDAFHSRAISSYDVVDYLDIKYNHLAKLQEAVQR